MPDCPRGHPQLWSGFSLLHIEDDERAHIEDLGKLPVTSRCLRHDVFRRDVRRRRLFHAKNVLWVTCRSDFVVAPNLSMVKSLSLSLSLCVLEVRLYCHYFSFDLILQ